MQKGKKSIKRKLLISLSLFFLPVLSFLVFPNTVLGRPILQGVDQIAAAIQSPQDLEKFMEKHFDYATDQNLFSRLDYWQNPDEMLANQQGDCEDYALFTQAVLSRNGYSTFLLSLYEEDNAHTVTLFEKDGRWGVFDLGKFRLIQADSLAELASQMSQDWIYIGIMRQDGPTGLISRKILPAFAKNFFLGDLQAFSTPRS